MGWRYSRRRFLVEAGAVGAGAALASAGRGLAGVPQAGSANGGIRFGYAAITWGDKAAQAIDDISAAGYPGIQLRNDVTKSFQPAALREDLQQHKLKFVALSSGDIHIDPSQHASDLEFHTANAKYLHEAGGVYLQLIDQELGQESFSAADYKYLAGLMTELGKRVSDVGVVLVYHNHLNSVSAHPEGLRRLFDQVDPRYVKLLLDIAHYQAGGGDPVEAIRQYKENIACLHIKDLGKPFDRPNDPHRLEDFVELGRGMVNLPAVFDALHAIHFRGWAIVELDHENDPSRSPKESAEISKDYLEQKLGMKV